ncbi:hypothetical protein Trydic_g10858 [Trypoxylus dichotomus]
MEKETELITTIKARKLEYFGHIMRNKNKYGLLQNTLQVKIPGKHGSGRWKNSWPKNQNVVFSNDKTIPCSSEQDSQNDRQYPERFPLGYLEYRYPQTKTIVRNTARQRKGFPINSIRPPAKIIKNKHQSGTRPSRNNIRTTRAPKEADGRPNPPISRRGDEGWVKRGLRRNVEDPTCPSLRPREVAAEGTMFRGRYGRRLPEK